MKRFQKYYKSILLIELKRVEEWNHSQCNTVRFCVHALKTVCSTIGKFQLISQFLYLKVGQYKVPFTTRFN